MHFYKWHISDRVSWIYSTSTYTKATILLGPEIWYAPMVIYRPASFISM